MNTDREYLELAAKAAEIAIDKSYGDKTGFDVCGNVVLDWHNGVTWNPIADDGDALRLAVKLRLHAKHFSPYEDDFDIKPPGMVEVWQEDGEDPLHIEYVKAGDDPLAATRRAIVRAAAELGRSMK